MYKLYDKDVMQWSSPKVLQNRSKMAAMDTADATQMRR